MTIRKNSVLGGEAAALNTKIAQAVALAREAGIVARWGNVRDENGRFLALKISEGLTPEDAVRELAAKLGRGVEFGDAKPETKSSRWARVAIGAGGGFALGNFPGAAIGGAIGFVSSPRDARGTNGGGASQAPAPGTISVSGYAIPLGSPEAPNYPGVTPEAHAPDKTLALAGAGGSIGALIGGVGAGPGALIGGAIGAIWDLLEHVGPFFDWGRVDEVGLVVLHPSRAPTVRRMQDLAGTSITPNPWIWRVVRGTGSDGSKTLLITPLVSVAGALQGKASEILAWEGNRAIIWGKASDGTSYANFIFGNADPRRDRKGSEDDAILYWGITRWEAMGITPPSY